MISLKESSHANWNWGRRSDLMPIVCWNISAITFLNVDCFYDSVFQHWVLFVIWSDKFNRRIIIRITFSARVNPFSIFGSNNAKVFISFIYTHHIFHGICMWSSKCSKTVPVRHFFKVEEVIHDFWKLKVFIQFSRRLCKTIVVMKCSILNLKRVKKVSVPKVYSFGAIWKVRKSIVKLSLSPYDFVTWSFLQVSLILPF